MWKKLKRVFIKIKNQATEIAVFQLSEFQDL